MSLMQPMLNIAEQAALAAGKLIMQYADRLDTVQTQPKGFNDLVTEVDMRSEEVIKEILHKAYPQHLFLAEESHGAESPYKQVQNCNDYTWIIDPLDGTINFSHGFPVYNVSIALMYKQQLQVAVIFDPVKNELFSAARGDGAKLNQTRIRVSKTQKLGMALIGTGFPFKYPSYQAAYLQSMGKCMAKTAGIRRAGAAALDLAYVACGRLDGFWELGLQPWDMAAGILLIQEAGGYSGDFTQPKGNPLHSGHLIAANPSIFENLRANVAIEVASL